MFNSLQIGRAIAALAVVLHHATINSAAFYGTAFSDIFSFGNIGVDFFFILSGFIIYWSHQKDHTGLEIAAAYAKKRFIRLYPPFILVALAMYLAYTLLPSLSMNAREIGAIPSLLLIPDPVQKPALSVSWTLMHELLFYSIFCIHFISPKALKITVSAWAIAIIVRATLGTESFWLNFLLSMHNLEFIMGMLIATTLPRTKDLQSQSLYILAIIAGGVIIFSFIIHPNLFDNDDLKTFYIGTGFALITLGIILLEIHKAPNSFNSKSLLLLGAASYSIYLVHNPALSVLNRVAGRIIAAHPGIPPEILFLFATTTATSAGIAYYFFWEKPILKLSRKILLPQTSRNGLAQAKQATL